MFGRSKKESRLNAKFKARIERKTANGTVLLFDAFVKGHFVANGRKHWFEADVIVFRGYPKMNIRSLFPGELKVLNNYAVKEIYPKLIGIKS